MQHPFEDLPLILATGQGRSGTTVLTKALAEHREIYSNRVESNVMHDVLTAGVASVTMPSRINQMVLSRQEHDVVFRRMLLHLLFPAGRAEPSKPKALSTFSAMNSEIAPYLIEVFPKVHFANIVRNGVEVVASRMVHRTMQVHSFEEHCEAWADALDMAEWGKDRAEFTLIRHEHLLQAESCAQTFKTLFQRSGLQPDPSCAEYVLNNRRNQTEYEGEAEDRAGDLTQRTHRWQFWSDEQRATFTDRCGPAMEYFGYLIPWQS